MFSHLYKPLIGSALIHTHFVSYVRDLIGMESLPLSEQCVVCVDFVCDRMEDAAKWKEEQHGRLIQVLLFTI